MRYLLVAVPALLAAALFAGTVQAQTTSYGDAMRALVQACNADIEKNCVGQLPGEGLAQCFAQHSSAISPGCNAALQASMAAVAQRANAQATAIQLCLPEANRFCKDYKQGRGHFLTCLTRVDIRPKVNRKCNNAITAAGWR